MARQRRLHPEGVACRGCASPRTTAPGRRCTPRAEIPFRVCNADTCRRSGGVACGGAQVIARTENLLGRAWRPDDTRLGQFRKRVAQPFRVCFVGLVGGALETEGDLDALLRFVGADDRHARSPIVSILLRLPHPRAAPHFGDSLARDLPAGLVGCQTALPRNSVMQGKRRPQ